MARETRRQPVYERYRKTGAFDRRFAGVRAALGPGDDPDTDAVTWAVDPAAIGALVPQPGDRLRDTAGRWWVVAEVLAPTPEGVYPCRCTRWKDGDE